MQNILITGTKGFIGSNLKAELSNQFKIWEINEDIFQSEDWMDQLSNLFDQVDFYTVFHVGACADTLEQNVNYMMLLNYQFTKHITDLCNKFDVNIIYSSSAANYGTNGTYPSNLYGWSKYVGEGYVISNKGIGLRYFNVYGPGEEHKGKMASVAYQMYIKYKSGEKCFLFPKKPLRDFVYVKDIVSANIYAMNNFSRLKGKEYEVGSGEARAFEDVMNLMEIPFEYLDESVIPEGYQFYTCSDSNKWMPGWEPKYKLDSGIKSYKECFK